MSAVRSRISSKLIFASCVGYFDLVYMKQNKVAVWSLVLLLVTGVRADPKYSYSYDIISMYVRIVTFDFSLKYVFHFFSRYLVVGSRYVFFSVSITCGATHAGRILFDTVMVAGGFWLWFPLPSRLCSPSIRFSSSRPPPPR